MISFEANNGVRVFIFAERLYKNYFDASIDHLGRYMMNHSDSEYQAFSASANKLLDFKKINDELRNTHPDFKLLDKTLLGVGLDETDSKRLIYFYRTMRHTVIFERNDEIMSQASDLILPLIQVGEQIHQNISANRFDRSNYNLSLSRLDNISHQMTPILNEFSEKLSFLSRRVVFVVERFVFVINIFLIVFGVYASRKLNQRYESSIGALKKSEQRLRLVTEQLPAVLWTVDHNLRITSVMGSGLAALNLQQDQVVGKTLSEFMQPRDPENISISVHQKALAGEPTTYESEFMGGIYLIHVEPFYENKRKISGAIGVAHEITKIKNIQKELVEEKERLFVTLKSIGDAVITTDRTGRLIMMNPVAEKLTGWTQTDAYQKELHEVFHIINEQTRLPVEDPVYRVISTGAIIGLANHTILISRDGIEWKITDSGAPIRDRENNIIGVVLVFRDVTEQEKMREEIIKTMKVESIGLLAGGIAHDFNNILTAILGNVSLAKIGLDPKSLTFQRLNETEKATLRARDLASQLLTFSRGGAPVKRIASVVEPIIDASEFALRGSNVRADFNFPQNLWLAMIDEGQIVQVVHNLVINALQAMPKGGVILVSAENLEIDAQRAQTLGVNPGHFISISFKDQGKGIPMDKINKIFDPFFTTKEQGSGLGLFSTYSIIKKHDGAIAVESEEGAGTSFFVYLPAIPENSKALEKTDEEIVPGAGRILVLDDDQMVRSVVTAFLQHLGYFPELASSGEEAIEMYKKAKRFHRPYDAVIMDLTLPGEMGGEQVIQALREFDPEVKGIVSSGSSNNPVMADYKKYGFKNCIEKPYRIQALSRVLNQALHP